MTIGCKHENKTILTEWDGVSNRAACIACDDCGQVFGMTKKQRREVNKMLSENPPQPGETVYLAKSAAPTTSRADTPARVQAAGGE